MIQRRVTFNGTTSPITAESVSEKWTGITNVVEERGGSATLECRLVIDYDPDFLDGLTDKSGYITLGGKIISPWEVQAEVGDHLPCRLMIGGDEDA